jgi:formylglycine-generating enzyme required for sulfatase activity
MHGNVAEWVADWYGPYPATTAAIGGEKTDQNQKVFRGGSFASTFEQVAPYEREHATPAEISSEVGFRCAADQI